MANEIVRYETDGGDEIELTPDVVRSVISTSPNVTDKEVRLFIELCRAHRLNPFIREAYLVKYGSNPATIVVGKDAFIKRAARNPRFKGFEAGVSVFDAQGGFHRRAGSMVLMGEQLVGGWCKVHVEGYEAPMFDEVSFVEYSTGKSNWARMPGTMVRKVAICHALREAFPEEFGGMYGEEEMGVDQQEQPAPQQPVEVQVFSDEPREAAYIEEAF